MKKNIKKFIVSIASVLLLLLIVLGVHIYIVTNPKVDETTRVLARIDFKQDINDADAVVISKWMYQQQGIDRVICNTGNDNVVFSYAPIKANGNNIVKKLRADLSYNAVRYMPDADDMNKGCPVSQTSVSYRIYSFIKNIF